MQGAAPGRHPWASRSTGSQVACGALAMSSYKGMEGRTLYMASGSPPSLHPSLLWFPISLNTETPAQSSLSLPGLQPVSYTHAQITMCTLAPSPSPTPPPSESSSDFLGTGSSSKCLTPTLCHHPIHSAPHPSLS